MTNNIYHHVGVGALARLEGFRDPERLPEGILSTLDKSAVLLAKKLLRGCQTYEGYMAWRKAWRKLYRDLGGAIVVLKAHRDGNVAMGDNTWETIRPHRQADVMAVRAYARWLMELRTLSKVIAGVARDMYIEEKRAERSKVAAAHG